MEKSSVSESSSMQSAGNFKELDNELLDKISPKKEKEEGAVDGDRPTDHITKINSGIKRESSSNMISNFGNGLLGKMTKNQNDKTSAPQAKAVELSSLTDKPAANPMMKGMLAKGLMGSLG